MKTTDSKKIINEDDRFKFGSMKRVCFNKTLHSTSNYNLALSNITLKITHLYDHNSIIKHINEQIDNES